MVNSISNSIDLQLALDNISLWCSDWQLSINVKKCVVLHLGNKNAHYPYFICGNQLLVPHRVCDLGILIDSDFSFESHINQLVTKAQARCRLFFKAFISRQPALMLKFFITYVRPLLECNSVVWAPQTLACNNKIEGVQRIFTNKIPGCVYLPYSTRLANLGLHSLYIAYRRSVSDLCCLFKSLNCTSLINLDAFVNYKEPGHTRGHTFRLVKPPFRLERTRKSFSIRSIDIWNSLPIAAFQSSSIAIFKRHVLAMIIDQFL